MLFYLLIFVFAAYHVYLMARRSKLPPGPAPIHLLGNMPQMAFHVWQKGSLSKALRAYQKEYGDIFTLWMGPLPTVHIASLELAHELMVKQGNNFADRWAPVVFEYIRDGKGIVVSNGDYWQDQRRFTLQTLRNFGVGRNLIEERIMMEFDLRSAELDEKIKNDENHIEGAKEFIDLMVGSIINRLLFSERFTKSNQKEFFHLKGQMDKITNDVDLLELFMKPWMLSIPFVKSRYQRFVTPLANLLSFVKNQVEERKEAIRKGEHIITDDGTDYVDAYLKKIEDEKDNPHTTYTEHSLLINLFDLWLAGQETTTTTLLWGFVYLLNHPEDKNETPYFNAAINEIHRLASILTINLFRQVREKTTVGDYIIEPGVPITAELSLIMSDEKDFKNTEKFYPERYLETEKLDQKVIPFGIGKRACPGESLARAEIYLLLGNMISKYEIEAVGKVPSMTETNCGGLFKFSEHFSMKFVPCIGK